MNINLYVDRLIDGYQSICKWIDRQAGGQKDRRIDKWMIKD